MERVSEILWGPWLVYSLLGLGGVMTVLTFGIQFRGLPRALGLLRKRNDPSAARLQLRTLVGASTGMGAIAGAAVALTVGGPGAVFWLWIATLLGMAISFAEGTLAAAARRDGGAGRPFAYVADLPAIGKPLAVLLALLAAIAALAAGGVFQAHQGAALLQRVEQQNRTEDNKEQGRRNQQTDRARGRNSLERHFPDKQRQPDSHEE